MRIISGEHKGRKLKIGGDRIRPTEGKVREAIFNILPHDLSDASVLDVFAGTGALGIEALSRGAFTAVFVDSGRESARIIKENVKELGLSERARVIAKKAGPAINLLSAEGTCFNLVFMDPPYHSGEDGRALEMIEKKGVLKNGALVIVEHHPRQKLSDDYGMLHLFDKRKYGGTAISFYRYGEEEDEDDF